MKIYLTKWRETEVINTPSVPFSVEQENPQSQRVTWGHQGWGLSLAVGKPSAAAGEAESEVQVWVHSVCCSGAQGQLYAFRSGKAPLLSLPPAVLSLPPLPASCGLLPWLAPTLLLLPLRPPRMSLKNSHRYLLPVYMGTCHGPVIIPLLLQEKLRAKGLSQGEIGWYIRDPDPARVKPETQVRAAFGLHDISISKRTHVCLQNVSQQPFPELGTGRNRGDKLPDKLWERSCPHRRAMALYPQVALYVSVWAEGVDLPAKADTWVLVPTQQSLCWWFM